MQSIQRRAQDNPLQLAAVGAAIAYPVWSLLRAIPTPLLLIGAGLFLTNKRVQQSAKEIKAKVDDVVQQGTENVSDFAGIVRSDLEDRFAGARYGAEELRDTGIRRQRGPTERRPCLATPRILRRTPLIRPKELSGAPLATLPAKSHPQPKASAPQPSRSPIPPKTKPPLWARARAMP